MEKFNLESVQEILKDTADYLGRKDLAFSNVKGVGSVDEQSLDWINTTMPNKEDYLRQTKAPFIICEKDLSIPDDILKNKTIIKVNSPKMGFAQVATAIFKKMPEVKIHPSAIIFPGAKIGNNVRIGPNTVIFDCVEIGDNVEIGANNTIGADGFGYERDKGNDSLYKFPHLCNVIIHSNVEIGNNTCIDRGALVDTVIGEGTKVDNLVHIAHNVNIGKNCCIIATSIIAGSVKIGDNTWIAPNATIREHLSIGKNVLVGLGAVVTKPIEDNSVISGFPALPFKKMITIFKGLLGAYK